jgi:hypothetical protein
MLRPWATHAVEIYDRAEAGKPIEISVGAVVLMEEVEGEYNGQKYNGKWMEVFPDHLALLPAGDIGACSIAMGCGVRTATVHRITAKGYELVTAKEEDQCPLKRQEETEIDSLKERWVGSFGHASPAGRSDRRSSELLEALEEKEPRMKYRVGSSTSTTTKVSSSTACTTSRTTWTFTFATSSGTARPRSSATLYAEVEAHTVYEVEDDENQANEVLITQLRAAQKIACTDRRAPHRVGAVEQNHHDRANVSINRRIRNDEDERIAAMIAASGGKLTDADKTWLTRCPKRNFANLEAANPRTATPAAPAAAVPVAAAAAPVPARGGRSGNAGAVPRSQPGSEEDRGSQAAQDKARRSFLVGKSEDGADGVHRRAARRDGRSKNSSGRLGCSRSADRNGERLLRHRRSARRRQRRSDDAPAPPAMNAAIVRRRGAK